jgi:hypothetical protein
VKQSIHGAVREDDATRPGAPARVGGLSCSAGDRYRHNVWGADHGSVVYRDFVTRRDVTDPPIMTQ